MTDKFEASIGKMEFEDLRIGYNRDPDGDEWDVYPVFQCDWDWLNFQAYVEQHVNLKRLVMEEIKDQYCRWYYDEHGRNPDE